MKLYQELRQRRVPQFASAYVVGGWGLLQFLAFLESRMAVSPHLVNLVGLALLLLLPSVITLAWVYGRPGKDISGRAPKIVVPANLIAVAVSLALLFSGRDLGAVTETITVQDENGQTVERVVPKSEYRSRILFFYLENQGTETEASASATATYLLTMDVGQDAFVDAFMPLTIAAAFQQAGSDDGYGLTRPLQRKIARDAHLSHFVTGSVAHFDDQWQLQTELHESDSGKILASRTASGPELMALVDLVSRQMREDLGIPSAHLEDSQDLPIAELASSDLDAVNAHVRAAVLVMHHNDWAGAVPDLEDAVTRDPGFTLAQFLLFSVQQTLGNAESASAAISAAMDNLYRVTERTGFFIKAQYYYSEKQEADKAMAVLRMWSQIYPDDVDAHQMLAIFYYIQQDLPRTIAAYERILEIDPSQVNLLTQLAGLHLQLKNTAAAEDYLKQNIAAFPTKADGYEELSDFYSATGRLDEARDALDQALLLEPNSLDLALSAVDLEIKSGRFVESKASLLKLLAEEKVTKEKLRVIDRLERLAGSQGQPSVVARWLDESYQISLEIQNPLQVAVVYSMRMPVLSEAGWPQEALLRLTKIKGTIPPPYDLLAGVGEAWILAHLGQIEEARTALAAAESVVIEMKFETYRSGIALVEGIIDEADGELTLAVAHYRKAEEKALQPSPTFQLGLVRALRLSGVENEAMDILQESMKVQPSNPRFLLEMAHLLFQQGKASEASEYLARARETWRDAEPEFFPAQEAQVLADQINMP